MLIMNQKFTALWGCLENGRASARAGGGAIRPGAREAKSPLHRLFLHIFYL